MNQLTPDQLDLLTRLQPLLKEKMGSLTFNDYVYELESTQIGIILQVDLAYFFRVKFDGYIISEYRSVRFDELFLRIPKPIDWQNENRGLLGMFSVPPILHFNPYLNKWCCERMHKNITKIDDYYAEDPFTALLKALCAQEEL